MARKLAFIAALTRATAAPAWRTPRGSIRSCHGRPGRTLLLGDFAAIRGGGGSWQVPIVLLTEPAPTKGGGRYPRLSPLLSAKIVDGGPPAGFAGAGFARHDVEARPRVYLSGAWYYCRCLLICQICL